MVWREASITFYTSLRWIIWLKEKKSNIAMSIYVDIFLLLPVEFKSIVCRSFSLLKAIAKRLPLLFANTFNYLYLDSWRPITIERAIEKRSYESIYKKITKIKQTSCYINIGRTITILSSIEKSPILLSQYWGKLIKCNKPLWIAWHRWSSKWSKINRGIPPLSFDCMSVLLLILKLF